MSRIVVSGIGVISSLGLGTDAHYSALSQGIDGLSRLELFDTAYGQTRFFGEVKLSNNELQRLTNWRDKGITRTSLLSALAFQQCIADGQLDDQLIADASTALVSANTVGGMCLTDEMYNDANRSENPSPWVSSYDSGSVTFDLQRKYSMRGWGNTINTACSSSANAIMYGARLIERGIARRAIVGGVDSLAKFTINGFNALHILSDEKCRPFDSERKGLNLGEGAAYLLLEREEDVKAKPYALLSGYGNSNDAFHASAISPEGQGPYLAMKKSLEKAKLESSDISCINAHGTGTENNDASESQAMLRLFDKVPPFSSTKAFTGHTLGAAGAIEAVISILSLQYQQVFPNLNFKQPDEGGIIPLTQNSTYQVKHIMSNSFGFGGNCSSLIFSAL